MRTDAFGGAPAAGTAPAPQPASAPLANASPPPASPPAANPPPAPSSAPATPPATPQVPVASKADKKAPHMPVVGNITKDNPTGDPSKEAPPAIGDNSSAHTAQMDSLFEEVMSLGELSGQGMNSLAELALVVCQAAKNGVISVGGQSTDVADLYAKYDAGLNKAKLDVNGDAEAGKNDKFHVSRLRQFAKLGAAEWTGNAPMFLAKAREIINKLDRKDTGQSTYSALVVVTRKQLDAIKQEAPSKGGKSKAKPLTEAAIKAHLIKPGAGEDQRTDNEIARDEIRALATKINKLIGGTDDRAAIDSDALNKAYSILNTEVARYEGLIKKEQGGAEE